MELFHVSTHNKKMNSIDMGIKKKCDIRYVSYLFYSATSFEEFLSAFNSDITKACSAEKKWSPEKLATEAIFEYVRTEKHPESPSRLCYAYFSESYEKAKEFNEKYRRQTKKGRQKKNSAGKKKNSASNCVSSRSSFSCRA